MHTKIQKLKQILEKLVRVVNKYPENQRSEIIFDKWNLENILAHLNGWHIQRSKEIEDFLANRPIPPINNFDEFNEKSVGSRKEKDWQEIYDEFIATNERLVTTFETIPEKLVNKKIWEDKKHTPEGWLDIDLDHLKGHLVELEETLDTLLT